MKNRILIGLAALSLTLSFFYEQSPETTSNSPAPTLQTASLLPIELPSSNFLNTVKPEPGSPSYKDTLFYNYHSQTLGVPLNYTEDKKLIETVADWLGTPYRSGANSKRGTDCSGFVTRVYKEVYGINLIHSSRSMFNQVQRVSKKEVKEGDLVFFRRGPGKPIYHVGIYLKNNKFVHSASNGGVRISSLKEAYYSRNYYAAGRVN